MIERLRDGTADEQADMWKALVASVGAVHPSALADAQAAQAAAEASVQPLKAEIAALKNALAAAPAGGSAPVMMTASSRSAPAPAAAKSGPVDVSSLTVIAKDNMGMLPQPASP